MFGLFGKKEEAVATVDTRDETIVTLRREVSELTGVVAQQAAREELALKQVEALKLQVAALQRDNTTALVEGYLNKWVNDNPTENIKEWYLQAKHDGNIVSYRFKKVNE